MGGGRFFDIGSAWWAFRWRLFGEGGGPSFDILLRISINFFQPRLTRVRLRVSSYHGTEEDPLFLEVPQRSLFLEVPGGGRFSGISGGRG